MENIELNQNLPIAKYYDDIIASIQNNPVTVIAGETGSGKTTQLPKLCLKAGRGQKQQIFHSQPRRIAARSVAQRIAEELKGELGQCVGLQTRFEKKLSEHTKIKVATDGILLAQINQDPKLKQYDTFIIDEAHERSLNIDFILGYLKRLLTLRDDIRIVITSATIDVDKFSHFFNQAPVFEIEGRTFGVEHWYQPLDGKQSDLPNAIGQALQSLIQEEKQRRQMPGDILVFLPTEKHIRDTHHFLKRQPLPHSQVLPLYARLPAHEQQKIFKPLAARKIVLTTNVAETSLTVPGIRYVIDSGLARIAKYNHQTHIQRIPIEAISQASAKQRAGRCGRTEPGICVHLYSEEDLVSRPEFTEPEIGRSNVAAVILKHLALNIGPFEDFPLLTQPEPAAIKRAVKLLSHLLAIDSDKQLTDTGKTIASLSLDPRLARILIASKHHQCLPECLIITSFLSIQDPRELAFYSQSRKQMIQQNKQASDSDFMAIISLWHELAKQKEKLSFKKWRQYCQTMGLAFARVIEWRDIHKELSLTCQQLSWPVHKTQKPASYEQIHRALSFGFFDQISQKLEKAIYKSAFQTEITLHPNSSLFNKPPPWVITAGRIDIGRIQATLAAKFDPDWAIPGLRHCMSITPAPPFWSKSQQAVLQKPKHHLFGLALPFTKAQPVKQTSGETQQLFIQNALIERQANSQLDWYQHNNQVILSLLEKEKATRKIYFDDIKLAAHYEKLIPQDITSLTTLEHWSKQLNPSQISDIKISEHTISLDHGQDLSQFPKQIVFENIEITLDYRFEPGHEADGVTANIPLALLHSLPNYFGSWLVPGIELEKAEYYLKCLPKSFRKMCQPHSETANQFLDQADRCHAFESELQSFLKKQFQLNVDFSTIEKIQATPYYQMYFQVIDNNQIIIKGRQLARLQADQKSSLQTKKSKIESEFATGIIIQQGKFGTLPAQCNILVNQQKSIAYPCLSITNNGDLTTALEQDRQKAQQHNQAALNHLVTKQFYSQYKNFTKTLTKSALFLKLSPLCQMSIEKIQQCLWQMAINHLFDWQALIKPQTSLDQKNFEQALQQAKPQLANTLHKTHETLSSLVPLFQKIYSQQNQALLKRQPNLAKHIEQHLKCLLSDTNILKMPFDFFIHLPRYYQGIVIRLEKYPGKVKNDESKQLEIQSYYDAIEQDLNQWQIGWSLKQMCEEMRIALFAQSLGSPTKISIKRLEKAWNNT